MRDKESQLVSQKQRLNSLHADQDTSDTTLASLERSISDKEKQIDR